MLPSKELSEIAMCNGKFKLFHIQALRVVYYAELPLLPRSCTVYILGARETCLD